MMPESHGHNYQRLNSDTRYDKATKRLILIIDAMQSVFSLLGTIKQSLLLINTPLVMPSESYGFL